MIICELFEMLPNCDVPRLLKTQMRVDVFKLSLHLQVIGAYYARVVDIVASGDDEGA
jgi:hypothetical protein